MINRDDFKNNKNLQVSLRTKQLHEKQLKEINIQKTSKEIESSISIHICRLKTNKTILKIKF